MSDLFFYFRVVAMNKLFPLFSLLLLLVACHHREQVDVLPPDRMVDFLCDAYVLEGYYASETQFRYDVVSSDMLHRYDSILDCYGLTANQVQQSLDYYSQHLELFQAIHDSVVVRLEALPRDTMSTSPLLLQGHIPVGVVGRQE